MNARLSALAACAVIVALLGSAFLIDPFADAAFDAPKRLALHLGAAIALAAYAFAAPVPTWRAWSEPQRILLALGLMLLLAAVLSASRADRPNAWDSLRSGLLLALWLPLGASTLLDGPWRRAIVLSAVVAIGGNALLSLLQASGVQVIAQVAHTGGRFPHGALLGNEGYVALAAACLGVCSLSLGLSVQANARPRRLATGTLLCLSVAVILVNRQLTAALALALGSLLVVAARFRHIAWLRPLPALLGLGAALVIATALVPGLRELSWARLPTSAESTTLDRVNHATTYRLGAWIAAHDMALSRPWLGHGPGSYATHALPYRLEAEARLHTRLINPVGAVFVHAHNDYLEWAAEIGLPALGAALVAGFLLLRGLWRRSEPSHAASQDESRLLFGLLGAGALAALAWFPLHIPLLAAVLLFALGRAWRLLGHAEVAP